MARPTWLVALIRAGFPGRFTLAGLTRWPVVGKALEKWLFDGDDMVFLPSDRVVQVGRDVSAPDQVVLPSILVERFINEANYHWVMDNCICRRPRIAKITRSGWAAFSWEWQRWALIPRWAEGSPVKRHWSMPGSAGRPDWFTSSAAISWTQSGWAWDPVISFSLYATAVPVAVYGGCSQSSLRISAPRLKRCRASVSE